MAPRRDFRFGEGEPFSRGYEELTARGLEVSEPVQFAQQDGATFMYFKDPDGNGWAVQEYERRLTEPPHQVLAAPAPQDWPPAAAAGRSAGRACRRPPGPPRPRSSC